jgi:23S rRNA pseudouridine1911/1915/1917 synthase
VGGAGPSPARDGGASFQRDLSAPIEERRFDVGAPDHGRRLDVFLAERMSWRSRTRIQSLIEDDRVTLESGRLEPRPSGGASRPRAGTRLRGGDRIVVRLDSAFVDAAAAAAGTDSHGCMDDGAARLDVLYEDDHLVAMNKPSGMNVYPTKRHLGGSLTELVHRRHRTLGGAGSPPSPCHRLDRETSGIVLFAKDRATRASVGRQFEERTVEKTYLALVAGIPTENDGVIDVPLGRDLASRVEIKQGPRLDGGGLAARTRWRTLDRFADARPSRSLLELRPETGRQHQLRAHLAAIGHAILGDKLYLGGDDLFLASLDRELKESERAQVGGFDRLALHAVALVIEHPGPGSRLRIEALCPGWSHGLSVI